ncbi:unnamed protein product [Rangifer tarandus platyrhynchus]|uniref:Uncharacterized protein n=3 Tax=Rangifer tarandus platyrhynchus TaxID=3082113 RepID=A0ACB0FMI8_RANTA|nr:unnamed protein product [Rangifer tarandus platyrhynchus]CAI9714302.1 unnamed protein product [Rangifer tarandus platyrhynchus]
MPELLSSAASGRPAGLVTFRPRVHRASVSSKLSKATSIFRSGTDPGQGRPGARATGASMNISVAITPALPGKASPPGSRREQQGPLLTRPPPGTCWKPARCTAAHIWNLARLEPEGRAGTSKTCAPGDIRAATGLSSAPPRPFGSCPRAQER